MTLVGLSHDLLVRLLVITQRPQEKLYTAAAKSLILKLVNLTVLIDALKAHCVTFIGVY